MTLKTAAPRVTAAQRDAAVRDAVTAVVAGARAQVTYFDAGVTADAGWIASAIGVAKALRNGASANAIAKANAAAIDADPTLKADAARVGSDACPLYTVRESVGYHGATGVLYMLPVDESTPLVLRASDVQTIVRNARNDAGVDAATAVLVGATSQASAVKALQALSRKAKADAAAAAKAKAEQDAADALAAALADDAADAQVEQDDAGVSTDRGQDDAQVEQDADDAAQVEQDAQAILPGVTPDAAPDAQVERLEWLLIEAATLHAAGVKMSDAAAKALGTLL